MKTFSSFSGAWQDGKCKLTEMFFRQTKNPVEWKCFLAHF